MSEWYAFEIEQVLSGNNEESKIAISGLNPDILAPKSEQLEAAFLSKRSYTKADDALCQQIKEGFKLLLRGKILFELLLRISFDRDYNSIHHKEVTSIWNMSIIEGLRTDESNCRRIVNIFEKRMNQK